MHRLSIGADLRLYPTLWGGLAPLAYDDEWYNQAVLRDGRLVFEPITERPGGVPRTASTWIAVHW